MIYQWINSPSYCQLLGRRTTAIARLQYWHGLFGSFLCVYFLASSFLVFGGVYYYYHIVKTFLWKGFHRLSWKSRLGVSVWRLDGSWRVSIAQLVMDLLWKFWKPTHCFRKVYYMCQKSHIFPWEKNLSFSKMHIKFFEVPHIFFGIFDCLSPDPSLNATVALFIEVVIIILSGGYGGGLLSPVSNKRNDQS